MLKSFPPQTSGSSLSDVLSEWGRIDPRAACDAALSLINENPNAYFVNSTVDSWFRNDADSARAWVLSLPTGKGRLAALTSMVHHLSSSDPDQAAKLYLTEFKPPLAGSTVSQIARNLALYSYPAACQFLIGLDEKIEARQITSTWQGILREWFATDPEAAGQFHGSLPESAFTTQLHSEFSAHSKTAHEKNPDPLQSLRNGTIHQQTLSENTAAELRKAVIQPTNQASYLSDYCIFLLRRNRDADIQQVLIDARDLAKQAPEPSGGNIPSVITACVQHLQKYHPQRIPAFLDSLAATSPEWLESAVAALWSVHFDRQGPRHRMTPLMASSLLRLSPEKRAKLMASSLAYARPLPEEWVSFLTATDHPNVGDEPHTGILLALAKADLPSALSAATQLPPQQSDPMICAILAAFPSRELVFKAIRALPPGNQPRVEAWHNALNPQAN